MKAYINDKVEIHSLSKDKSYAASGLAPNASIWIRAIAGLSIIK